MGWTSLLLPALVAALVGVTEAIYNPVFESLAGVPDGWSFARKAAPSQLLRLSVAVQQQHLDLLEEKLVNVSTPGNPDFHRFMTASEVKALVKPTNASTEIVMRWLDESDTLRVEDDGEWITFVTTVGKANTMLGTEFAWYRNHHKHVERLRTTHYAVPLDVAAHIDFVQPTTRFGGLEPLGSTVEKADGPRPGTMKDDMGPPGNDTCGNITPKCLMERYNIHYKADSFNGNKLGYASFLEQYARYDDLQGFEWDVAHYAWGENFSVIELNGGRNDQQTNHDSDEANMNSQYLVSLAYPVPVTELSVAGRGPVVADLDHPDASASSNEPYLDYLQALLKVPNEKLPQTISHSYGEDEQSVPKSYAMSVCNMFAQLGVRGVSVLFASGDGGVGTACMSNDGSNTTQYQPQFPASCPWVTAVGGTTHFEPEVATYFSGGGFSRYFGRPAWQARAVERWFDKVGNKYDQYINREGRGYPDVAAQSIGYLVRDKGKMVNLQGTSCATPTFAAVISMLNSARITGQHPPLGFLNPWLYAEGLEGLKDVIDGGSRGCNGYRRFNGPPNGSPVIENAGFNATEGWDPVTGLGTPDFGKLMNISTPYLANEGGPVGPLEKPAPKPDPNHHE